MRINRALALTGHCSRRKADQLIEEGRVCVNGATVKDFSLSVDLDLDVILVDGRPLASKNLQYMILHKPKDVITTCDDPGGRRAILDILPGHLKHLKPVGRLDRNSEGLLILTNDGDLAQKLAHPSTHIWKTYKVTVKGNVRDRDLETLVEGVELSGGRTLPARLKLIARENEKTIFEISIREGKNRQIRRMCAQLGYPVNRLVRVAIGRLQLKPLAPGEWRLLSREEIEKLCGVRR
ncbi:MAG: pseudouridine synthase [Cyanobacteriota/Melainabacteria group bacterium]|nr:rRNA pseudouridine synthase [Cyanobacteria bacterium HKST-UBA01]